MKEVIWAKGRGITQLHLERRIILCEMKAFISDPFRDTL